MMLNSMVCAINDTVASLFANLTDSTDAYIGLIVGTGTNMATLSTLIKFKETKS